MMPFGTSVQNTGEGFPPAGASRFRPVAEHLLSAANRYGGGRPHSPAEASDAAGPECSLICFMYFNQI